MSTEPLDSLVTLTEAAKLLPPINGARIHVSTLWRWCRKGVRGVHLEYRRVGRRILVAPEALDNFTKALAAADECPSVPRPEPTLPRKRTPVERTKAIDAARRELRRMGV